MKNETTASQPKSIGNDAKFLQLLTAVETAPRYSKELSEASAALIIAIDSKLRAPAAQASATIQAAPEGWAVDYDKWSSPDTIRVSNPKWGGCFLGFPKAGDIGLPALMHRYFADAISATIQEPVMVAEPVEKAATKLCGRLLCLPQVRDGNNIYVTASAVNACVKEFLDTGPAAPMVAEPVGEVQANAAMKLLRELRQLDEQCEIAPVSELYGDFMLFAERVTKFLDAARMVADPAGVAGQTIGEVFASVGGWMNGGELGYPSFGSMDALRVFTQRSIRAALAATVKAVPSEAVAWISVKDGLPKADIECTSREMNVSGSFFVRGIDVDGGEGCGLADYQEDGTWHCYGGNYDFMHIVEVTHYLPVRAPLADKTGGGE